MTGNETEAEQALAGTLEYLGKGCTRIVYINESRTVVYKVEHFDSEPDHTSNYDEYALSDITLPEPFVIPNMTLYPNGVLAMDYIDGLMAGECFCTASETCQDDCHPSHIVDKLMTVSPDCATWGNTVWKDGKLYLIDLGH